MASFLPPEVLAPCLKIGAGILIFWLVQPLVFLYCLIDKPLWTRTAAAVWYGATIYGLADSLRVALGEYYTFNVNLLWWIFALISVKYVHAVLDASFGKAMGLTSLGRIALFCYSPATVVFDVTTEEMDTTRYPRRSALFYVARGIGQLVAMGQIAQTVLDHGLDEVMPLWMHSIVGYNLITLSQGGLADVAFSATARAVIGLLFSPNDDKNILIVEPADAPILSTVPRYFWHRWSKSPGFHLRLSIYDRVGGRQNQLIGTMLTFGLNCVLHVTWWGYVSSGKLAWNYIHLLMVAPMISLALDKFVLVPLVKKHSVLLYHVSGWISLQAIVVCAFPFFLDAQGLPTNLHDVCLVLTGKL